jgi:serine/threonine protein kinase
VENSTTHEEFGAYRLTHLLGKGGMASVYRAVRSGPMGFAKEVAIKRIHDALVDNEAILKGLINEARIGGQLKHPHIVEIYEFNKVGDAYYLAMEFVDGWTLDKVVKLSREFKMPIPPGVVLQIGQEICEGLDYAHNLESLDGQAVKLVHRDLKPANIILSRYGSTKIMDFGIAKAETNLFKTTMADVTKGTPHYMSPEQVAGASDLGGRSDLFALGALLYELCTGKVLFVGDALPTVLFNVVKAEVGPQIAEADGRVPGIGPILERLLKKDPKDRPESAGVVGTSLTKLRDSSFADSITIKQYLYSLRDRMVMGATRSANAIADEPTVADHTVDQIEGEPEFATMLGPAEEAAKQVNLGLEEARRAADAAIAGNRVFSSETADPVDTSQETMVGVDPGPPAAAPTKARGAEMLAPSPPAPTNPNQKQTRKIQKPGTEARKKQAWSPGLLLVALLLGVLLLGTSSWIIKELFFTGTPVAAAPDPAPQGPADLEIPDLTIPSGDPTPAPRASVRSGDPAPAPRRDSTPAPAVARPTDPTPTGSAATTDPTPKAPPAPASPAPRTTPDPTPAPAEVVAAAPVGRGRVSIKFSKPYYGRVWIDGIDTGRSTPVMGLELPAGKHTIELVADEQGRRSAKRTVSVTNGGHVKLGHYDFDTDSWED